jgi:hypothetical protein
VDGKVHGDTLPLGDMAFSIIEIRTRVLDIGVMGRRVDRSRITSLM